MLSPTASVVFRRRGETSAASSRCPQPFILPGKSGQRLLFSSLFCSASAHNDVSSLYALCMSQERSLLWLISFLSHFAVGHLLATISFETRFR